MDRAERVRELLSARGLTLYGVSRQSAQIFDRSSRFHVPHNLYGDVANPSFVPTIHQILALSHITNYRVSDWLAVFGIKLDAITRLQLLIPRKQTVLLDSSVYDTHAWIPWLTERPGAGPIPSIAPLGQFLSLAKPKRAGELLALNKGRFLYGKVGEEDHCALPHFSPGSIVRVNVQPVEELWLNSKARAERPFFFVEHEFGCNCSQLVFLAKDRVLLHSPQHPCAQRELRLGREARIVGIIDAEIRRLRHQDNRGGTSVWAALNRRRVVSSSGQQINLRDLLRNSRTKMRLSFREASSLSRRIASTLSDELYFVAPSTLSDYETLTAPPRHIQKIITLCILYSIGFQQFLRASGLLADQEGQDPMPDELVPRGVPEPKRGLPDAGVEESSRDHAGVLDLLWKQWREIPLFLRHSFEELTGLKNFSLSDVFWVGGDKEPIHPLLVNATLAVVNRRVKKVLPAQTDSLCKQPLYLILKRDGTYLCGRCVLDQNHLVVPSYPASPVGIQRFRNGIDAEVLGQVTAILRSVL